MWDNKFIVKKK